jgi:hypothetical protein
VIGVDMISRSDTDGIGCEMRDDLMAVEIEVDPPIRAASFLAAEHTRVELAGGFEIMNRKREME